MKNVIEYEGYRLHLIPTNKFKNVTIVLKMAAPLVKEKSTLRTLLSFMFTSGTKKLPSPALFSGYLDELYGSRFSSSIGTKGKAHVIQLASICIDHQYLKEDEDLLSKQIGLIHDVLFEPNATNGEFDSKAFNQQKQELKWRFQALKDDKYSYSLERMFEEMGKNDTLGISTYGYESELDSITSSALYDYYLQCLDNDVFDIYVVGDIDDGFAELFASSFPLSKRNKEIATDTIFKTDKKEVLVIKEKQDIVQAKLNIGYTIDTDFTSPDHYAFTLFNGLFGGFAHSLLFKVVREEHSLCYYVSSSYDAFNGIMIVNAGIETKNYDKTVELIQSQLTKIQNGDLSPELLNITKNMLENSLRKTEDEAASIISLRYNRDITHKEETNEEYIERLNAVTLEDIIRVSQKVKLDTIYLLEGRV